MRKAWIVACAVLFVSAAGFSQTPSLAPLSGQALAMVLGQPAVTGSCPAQQSGALFAAKNPGNGIGAMSTCTANCQYWYTRSCSGSTCTAVDDNCSGPATEPGHVTCDGNTIWCAACEDLSIFCQGCYATGDCYDCCRCGESPALYCSHVCE